MNVRAVSAPLIAAFIAIGSTSALAAPDAKPSVDRSWLGKPIAAAVGAKTIDVTKVKTINIDCGEVVTFRNGEKTFTWKFDVVGHRNVDLKSIAPADFNAPDVRVYVSRNDSERS